MLFGIVLFEQYRLLLLPSTHSDVHAHGHNDLFTLSVITRLILLLHYIMHNLPSLFFLFFLYMNLI